MTEQATPEEPPHEQTPPLRNLYGSISITSAEIGNGEPMDFAEAITKGLEQLEFDFTIEAIRLGLGDHPTVDSVERFLAFRRKPARRLTKRERAIWKSGRRGVRWPRAPWGRSEVRVLEWARAGGK